MHSGAVSPQPARGNLQLTVASISPTVQIHFTLPFLFSTSPKMQLLYLKPCNLLYPSVLSASCCPGPDAWKCVVTGGSRRESYSWKNLSHSCCCSLNIEEFVQCWSVFFFHKLAKVFKPLKGLPPQSESHFVTIFPRV